MISAHEAEARRRKERRKSITSTGIPHLLKVCFYATLLLQKSYISACFAEQKKFQESFQFYEEKKGEKSLHHVLQRALIEAVYT